MNKLFNHMVVLDTQQFIFPYCNCLYIEDEISCVIDSSPAPEEMEYLKDKRLDLIINSHGHFDHVSRNPDFKNVTILMHPADHPLVASGEAYLDSYGFSLFPDDIVRSLYLQGINYRSRPADGCIGGGDKIELGRTSFEVVHLPGHTAGHCGFLFPDLGLMFTADIDLDSFGPWYGNVDANLDDLLASIELVKRISPEILVTGHGPSPVTENISNRLDKYRDRVLKREEEIIQLLYRGKKTVREIASEKPIYRRFPEPQRVFLLYECMMDLKHLDRLERLGKVIREKDQYCLIDGIRPSNLNLG